MVGHHAITCCSHAIDANVPQKKEHEMVNPQCEENPSTGVRTAGWELAEIARGEENGTQMREYSGFPQTPRLVTRPPAVNMASAVGKKYDLCMVLVQRAGIKNRRKPLLVREALETQMWTFGQAFRGRPRPRAGQRLPRVSQTKSRLRG